MRPDPVRDSYDAAAEGYAAHLADELVGKPLDRHLLDRFAEELRGQGLVADLGCGPGHVARYLSERGVGVMGIDLSPEMVRVAAERSPDLEFRVGDLRTLDLEDGGLAGAVLFYAIVHFDPAELPGVFAQVRRVLRPGGLLLSAFHVGDQEVHVDDLFGATVSLDFRFFPIERVAAALASAGFQLLERCEREPYPAVEYPSRRAYLLCRAI